NLCKGVLDLRPRDTQLLSQINEVWDQPLQHWDPEHGRPQEWELRNAIDRGEPEGVIARIRSNLAARQLQVDLKREIIDWRAPLWAPVLDPAKHPRARRCRKLAARMDNVRGLLRRRSASSQNPRQGN